MKYATKRRKNLSAVFLYRERTHTRVHTHIEKKNAQESLTFYSKEVQHRYVSTNCVYQFTWIFFHAQIAPSNAGKIYFRRVMAQTAEESSTDG